MGAIPTQDRNSIAKLFKYPIRTIQQLFRIARFCSRTTPLCSRSYTVVFLRALRLWCKDRFSPKEAFQLGLLNSDLPNSELNKYASRKIWTKVQQSLNPQQWAPLLKDKSIFYRYCIASDIPIPKLYAIFFKNVAGWSYENLPLQNREEWEKFLHTLPKEFVIKPAYGALGRGIKFFIHNDNKTFTGPFETQFKDEDIYDAMLHDPKYDTFIIQRKLKNHPNLLRLTDTKNLQTIRIITFVDTSGQSHILRAHLKLIVGRNVTDNFENGQTGNMQTVISLDTGRLRPAITMDQNGRGIKTIFEHPKTKISFDKFQLPLWSQIRKLVEETSMKFLPVRTIGWDVALTPEGPLILEGNIWWNPPNQHRCMDTLLETLSCNPK